MVGGGGGEVGFAELGLNIGLGLLSDLESIMVWLGEWVGGILDLRISLSRAQA